MICPGQKYATSLSFFNGKENLDIAKCKVKVWGFCRDCNVTALKYTGTSLLYQLVVSTSLSWNFEINDYLMNEFLLNFIRNIADFGNCLVALVTENY